MLSCTIGCSTCLRSIYIWAYPIRFFSLLTEKIVFQSLFIVKFQLQLQPSSFWCFLLFCSMKLSKNWHIPWVHKLWCYTSIHSSSKVTKLRMHCKKISTTVSVWIQYISRHVICLICIVYKKYNHKCKSKTIQN